MNRTFYIAGAQFHDMKDRVNDLAIELEESKERDEDEEPELRRHRLPGEFDDWPSNAQMEYFKRGGR
jgi:hypothetical protein